MTFAEAVKTLKIPTPGEMIRDARQWAQTKGKFWGASFGAHLLVLVPFWFIIVQPPAKQDDAALFDVEKVEVAPPETPITKFEVGDTPVEPTVLNTETLAMTEAPAIEQTAEFNDNSATFEKAGGGISATSSAPLLGGLNGFDVAAIGAGPVNRGKGGVGTGVGTGTRSGSGGGGEGFGGRGSGSRQASSGSGITKHTERAVAGGLNWLSRHQNPDGSWSLHRYNSRCKGGLCKGHGSSNSDMAGTAFALLPYLAAGQTHKSGPYSRNIDGGLKWMIRSQRADGALAPEQTLYSHGLASIVLCEAYGLSKDPYIGAAAQKAILFIEKAQVDKTGGWDYQPNGASFDTSVSGWQLMAIKSSQMAGLKVSDSALAQARKWLKGASGGTKGGLFKYRGDSPPSPTMTAVGLLCSQYMGMQRNDPAMQEGFKYLMANPPAAIGRNCYYWYYATQVMHNLPGPEWDSWNRQMRKILIDTQVKDGCGAGSWDPEKPAKDPHGEVGGRIMVTSIATLTLEIYYRYLPLYQLDSGTAVVMVPLSKKEETAGEPKSESKSEPKAETKKKAEEKPAKSDKAAKPKAKTT